jgi:membrane AbrB-like protein
MSDILSNPILRTLIALLVGAISGVIAASIGMALPWMLGPMVGVTALALMNAPIRAPMVLRPWVVPVIGVLLGSGFYPGILGQLGTWAATFALLPFYLAVAATASFLIYRRIGTYDPVTAFFASMPGGLNEMLILGEEAGGDGKKIALAHATRILFVISCVGLFFGLVLGVQSNGSAKAFTAVTDLTIVDAGLLIFSGISGVYMGRALRFPAAAMLGPMVVSAGFHLSGLVSVAPPTIVVICAQIIMGTVVGCRFIGTSLGEIRFDLYLGLLSAIAMICVAVGFSEMLALLTDTTLTAAFLAFSPGGLTEMSLLALTLGIEVAYVAVVHVVRIVVIIFSTGLIFAALRRYFRP